MIRPSFKEYAGETQFLRNVLYKVNTSDTVCFIEKHSSQSEIVDITYCLEKDQYGIYAEEFRNPVVCKQGCKTADVLACIVDDANKTVLSMIFDVKSNICAFSDDLLKDGAMLTVINEVRDFTEQIHDEILHKNTFMLYYKDDGYREQELLGLVTKNFEGQKFVAAAEVLESLFEQTNSAIPRLVELKLKKNLMSYKNENIRLREFAEKKIRIGEKLYDLQVFQLEKVSEEEYRASVLLRDDR